MHVSLNSYEIELTGGTPMKIRIADLLKVAVQGHEAEIAGWVRSVRASTEVVFNVLNDGSNMAGIQVVADKRLDNFAEISRLGTGAALRVTGKLVQSPAAGQAWELAATGIRIIGAADETYPMQKKRHSFEYLREIAHLRP